MLYSVLGAGDRRLSVTVTGWLHSAATGSGWPLSHRHAGCVSGNWPGSACLVTLRPGRRRSQPRVGLRRVGSGRSSRAAAVEGENRTPWLWWKRRVVRARVRVVFVTGRDGVSSAGEKCCAGTELADRASSSCSGESKMRSFARRVWRLFALPSPHLAIDMHDKLRESLHTGLDVRSTSDIYSTTSISHFA